MGFDFQSFAIRQGNKEISVGPNFSTNALQFMVSSVVADDYKKLV